MTAEEKIQIIEILKDLPYPKESAKYPIAEKEAVVNKAIDALETVSCIKEKCAYCPHCEHCDVDDETLAIKNMRYKPVILQEHDAEPRRLNAILDTKTKEVYVRAALTGFTIEEVER